MEKRKLDVGCGGHKVAGAIGLDWIGATQADVICDLRKFPWPLEESSFDEIYAYNVLEHLPDTVGTMEEIHRVGRDGALVHIRTPHFASLESWEDPTHVHHFSLESFDYFCDGTRHVGHYSPKRFRVVSKKLHFGGHPISIMGRLLCAMNTRKYEKRWAFMFRPGGMDITLAIVKP